MNKVSVLIIAGALFLLVPSGCATFKKGGLSRVEIKTVPDGAEIFSIAGEKLGESPLVLEGSKLISLINQNRLNLKVKLNLFVDREIAFDVHGVDTFEIRLDPVDDKNFGNSIVFEYSKKINKLTRSILRIQGLLLEKKLNEAETSLKDFQNEFQNIASSYVFQGNIEDIKGKKQEALKYYKKARLIDPDDRIADKYINVIKK